MATKSVSTFAIFFILFLVIFEVPETKAQDSECLKEYGGDVGFSYCAPQIYPSFCYQNCIKNKGAYGGICVWGDAEAGGVKCLCDFCSLDPGSGLNEPGSSLNNEVSETKAQDNECLKEYGGDVGFSFCAPRIFPTFCYQNCRTDKGAKGGRCVWGDADSGGVKCLCDFCSDKPGSDLNDRYTF